MEQATVAEQEYLEIMFWLEEAGLPMTGANIARAMQLSPPTVHEMIGRLSEDGYVERKPDKSLEFTESGREHASHRAAPDDRASSPTCSESPGTRCTGAERIEHAMSPVLEECAGDRRRDDLPARPPDPRGHPRAGLAAGRRRGRRNVVVLRFESRRRSCCTT
jgi:DtxR family Mn-dependent transcriptional regulator